MSVLRERFECDSVAKFLLSTKCRYDCKYCPNAWMKGESVGVEDLVAYVRVRGLKKVFVSSAIFADNDEVMEEIISAGAALRNHVSYLHLKIMPYSSKDLIAFAAEIADRISLNLESPCRDVLSDVSSFKDLGKLFSQLKKVAKHAKRRGKSFTTQIIVGLGETDYDALNLASKVYELGAARVYYSPFVPVPGTPLENLRAESRKRVARLYRADALLRLYGVPFRKLKEILVDGYLPRRDPKRALKEIGVELDPHQTTLERYLDSQHF